MPLADRWSRLLAVVDPVRLCSESGVRRRFVGRTDSTWGRAAETRGSLRRESPCGDRSGPGAAGSRGG